MINQVFENNHILTPWCELSEVSVGQHLYWQIGEYQVHGQVLLTSWFVLGTVLIFGLVAFFFLFVLGTVLIFGLVANTNLKPIPAGPQNFSELVTEFIRDLAKTQVGEEDYLKWVPFLGTIFIFIFVSNWSGALLPWHLIELPSGELAAPTNDINTTET